MKQINIRVNEEQLSKLNDLYEQCNFRSRNDLYQKIIDLGMTTLIENSAKKYEEIKEVSCAVTIENRYYLRNIYRLLFDASKSKFDNVDDEIEAAKSGSKSTTKKLLNGDLQWTN